MRPRMKWYWRALLSFGSGALTSVVSYLIYGRWIDAVLYGGTVPLGRVASIVVNMGAYGIVHFGVVRLVYHRLTASLLVEGTRICGL